MIKINRRDFLKGSAALGVAGALSGTVLNTLRPSTAQAEESTAAWTPSMCLGCTTWCSVEVKTQINTGIKRAIDVRGNRNANTHGGYVCPRGRIALQEFYDADRVKAPMKRTNLLKGRGVDPGFIPISWDAAISEIATKIKGLRDADKQHQITLMRGRYSGVNDILFDSMGKIIGAAGGYISHSAICAEGENFARQQVSGLWGYPDYDIDNCKYLLLWGVDPVSSNRMVAGAIHKLGERIGAGMKVTSIDPRLHATAAKAHRWLPVKPGTDGALALAIAHWILNQGMWNTDFAFTGGTFPSGSNYTGTITEKGLKGVGEWWNNAVKTCTPSWAATITGISDLTIKQVACEFAGYAYNPDGTKGSQDRTGDEQCKAISWIGPGVTMAPRGAYAGMSIEALNGLVGSMDHLGGVLPLIPSVSVSGTPSVSSYQDALAKQGYYKQRIDKYTDGAATGSDLNSSSVILAADLLTTGKVKGVKGSIFKSGSILKIGTTVVDYADRVAIGGSYDGDLKIKTAEVALAADRMLAGDITLVSGSTLKSLSTLTVGANVEKAADRTAIGGIYYGGVELGNPQIGSGGVGATKSTNRVGKAIKDASPYKCEMLLTNFANFAFSCGETKIWEDALSGANAPYHVDCGTNATESAMFADIVLPAKHHMMETKTIMGQKARKSNVVGLMNEVITPLWDAKDPETEVTWLIAEALNTLGFTSLKSYYKGNFKINPDDADHADASAFQTAVQKYYAVGTLSKLTADRTTISDSGNLKAKVKLTTGSTLITGSFLRKGTKATGLNQTALNTAGYTGGYQVNADGSDSGVMKADYILTADFTTTSSTFELIAGSVIKSGSTLITGTNVEHGDDRKKLVGTYNDDGKWTAINGPYASGIGNGIRQATYKTDTTEFDSNGRGRAWIQAANGTATTASLGTKSKKMEVYNTGGNLYSVLNAHASALGTTVDAVIAACNYTATGSIAYMPHWEEPKIDDGGAPATYNFTFIDHKSRINREGRSQNTSFYGEFKQCDAGDEKWKDVVKINPADAAALGVANGNTVRITSPSNPVTGITCIVKLWEGVRKGTVAKSFGQGHWAYGRFASKTDPVTGKFTFAPNGGNNNEILPGQYERLSGSTARNGVTKVHIVKI